MSWSTNILEARITTLRSDMRSFVATMDGPHLSEPRTCSRSVEAVELWLDMAILSVAQYVKVPTHQVFKSFTDNCATWKDQYTL